MNGDINPPPLSEKEREHGAHDDRDGVRKHASNKRVVRREIKSRISSANSNHVDHPIESDVSGFEPNLVIFLACTLAIVAAFLFGAVILLYR